jgi:GAF domain-containing protein
MEYTITLSSGLSKKEKYEAIIPQLKALTEIETDRIANLASICAVLKETFQFLWVGFYLVKDEQLVLGPFQGPPACTRINKGKGVCGKAWETLKTIIVPDVSQFPGHIACSSLSKSEIVVPVFNNGICIGVLDIDSEHLSFFDTTDAYYLEELLRTLSIGQ